MTDEVTTNSPDTLKVVSSSLGKALSTARIAKNLSLKEVSNHLRLSVAQIEALESDNFAALPQPMATRGFIRNYARLLEVDAEPLLESYRTSMPDGAPSALSVQTSMTQVAITKGSQPQFKYILGSILLILFLSLCFFYISNSPKLEPVPVKNAAIVSEDATSVVVPMPEIALPAAERQSESIDIVSAEKVVENTADIQPAPIEKEKMVKDNVANTTPSASLKPSVQLRSSTDVNLNALKTNVEKSVQVPTANTVKANVGDLANGKNVTVSVSEEAWIQVKDKTGAVIYEKKIPANTTDGFDGLPPLYLWVGNAKATTVTFLGKPVDLTSKTKNNIARITLE